MPRRQVHLAPTCSSRPSCSATLSPAPFGTSAGPISSIPITKAKASATARRRGLLSARASTRSAPGGLCRRRRWPRPCPALADYPAAALSSSPHHEQQLRADVDDLTRPSRDPLSRCVPNASRPAPLARMEWSRAAGLTGSAMTRRFRLRLRGPAPPGPPTASSPPLVTRGMLGFIERMAIKPEFGWPTAGRGRRQPDRAPLYWRRRSRWSRLRPTDRPRLLPPSRSPHQLSAADPSPAGPAPDSAREEGRRRRRPRPGLEPARSAVPSASARAGGASPDVRRLWE